VRIRTPRRFVQSPAAYSQLSTLYFLIPSPGHPTWHLQRDGLGWNSFESELLASSATTARRKWQLAQIMHKDIPWRASKCVVSALSCVAGAHRKTQSEQSPGGQNLLWKNDLCRNCWKKTGALNRPGGRRFCNVRQTQVGCAEVLAASRALRRPCARCTLIIRSMNIRSRLKNRGEHQES
jgi:hypothetical protein